MEESDGFNPKTPWEFFRELYYETIDITASEITRQFEQKGLRILNEIENILILSYNGVLTKLSNEFTDMYKGDVDFERLMPQLSMLTKLVKVANRDSSITVKEVTAISTICELMNTTLIGKAMSSKIHKLLCLYLTVPMTSTSAESTFLTLRRLKNYLCLNMSWTFEQCHHFTYSQRLHR